MVFYRAFKNAIKRLENKKLLFDTVNALMGVAINNPSMQDFFAEHGFKPPKKTTISGTASDYSVWVEHSKLGVDLLFSIEINNPLYTPPAGDKKSLWIPILKEASFKKNQANYPFGLTLDISLEEAKALLGEASYKSSDISKIWLKKDGTESFYGWQKMVDEARQIALNFRIKPTETLNAITLSLLQGTRLIPLYNPLKNQTMSDLLNDTLACHRVAVWLEWSILNGLYMGTNNEQVSINNVKAGTSNGVDFLRNQPEKSNLYLEQFAQAHQAFVRQYLNNLSTFDVLYARDYAMHFLSDAALRQNYMGEKAELALSQLAYSDEHKQMVFTMLDERFAEFKAHGFAKSQPILNCAQ
jgi:hypothetical protein